MRGVLFSVMALLAFLHSLSVAYSFSMCVTPCIGNSIVPMVTATVPTTCVAPCAVFFDATATTASETSFPIHELNYAWNFNDSDAQSKNWSYGSSNSVNTCGDAAAGQQTYCTAMPALNKNHSTGPVVGHVFHVAGTYTPTLTVTGRNGAQSLNTSSIVVSSPDTIWGGAWCLNSNGACGGAGTNCRINGDGGSVAGSVGCTVCLSNTATYTNCPAVGGHDPLTQCCVVQNIINNYLVTTTPYRVLLHAGETFNTDSTAANSPTEDCSKCMLGSYDTGAQPIIATQVAFSSTFSLEVGKSNVAVSNVIINNVQIDGFTGFANGCIQIQQGADTVLIENVTCTTVHEVLLVQAPVGNKIKNVFLVNISAKNIGGTGTGSNCGSHSFENNYIQYVNNLAIQGWDLENGTNEQSMMRFQSWQDMDISYNYFARPCLQRATYDIRGDGNAATIDQNVNVHHNVSVGEATAGNLSGPGMEVDPQVTDGNVQNVIFSENFCILGSGSNQCISTDASLFTMRNNIISAVNIPAGLGGIAEIFKWNGNGSMHSNVWAYNNTYYCGTTLNNNGVSGNSMFTFQNQYSSGGTVLKNNMYYCPGAPSPTLFNDSSTPSSPVTANNTSSPTTNPLFSNGGGSMLLTGDYTLQGGSYGKAAGTTVPVFFDFSGASVPKNSPTIGAFQ